MVEETRITSANSNIHLEMQRDWQQDDESLPMQTAPARDLCNTWVRIMAIYGPKDLGNGPVYALDIVDEERSLFETTYIGSRQVVDKLANPKLPEYLRDYDNCMMLLLLWHERGDKGYYTAKVWFGVVDAADKPSGSIG